ncbi:peptidase E [Amnibacterium sp. CER49]|uniref:Type 1 glutamine amidotransferase-like domain-containing protein n=1 Tax=Amnibacterium sp. CER49 TaxID=3039161 RepID=UPI00244B8F6A|nr:peptidase E [Amnibacterium sp. CER49]MDH2444845.1 peptidase E [Amnibacterium sp. CER49]
MSSRHIVAGSAGYVSDDGHRPRFGPTIEYALTLRERSNPRIAYLGTATGDAATGIAAFYDAASQARVEASHLQLFPLPNHLGIEEHLLAQDVIWVGGGSVANLVAVWRVHGLDHVLRKAWDAGIVLAGVSAGAICWSVGGPTDSFGVDLKPFRDGLGLLPYSCGVHYDSEERRRPLFQRLIASGELPDGYATDDGVMIHFAGDRFVAAVSDRPDAFAYRVHLEGGAVQEDRIEPRLLAG